MILTRLTSVLLLMLLTSTVLGAWIDTNGEDEEEDWTDETVNTEEPLSFNDDLKSPRQHKIPGMTKIIGGRDAVRGETPWQARLEIVLRNGKSKLCGAVIINQDWLLTAAHCLLNRSRVRVFVGDYRLSQRDVGEKMFEVDDVIIHEQYELTSENNDIALLKIRPTSDGQRIQFNKYVRQIQLPDSTTNVYDGTPCSISGWGYYRYGLPPNSDILQSANVQIVGQQKCAWYYRPTAITDNMICAGDMNRGIGVCFGDSGGPLVCRTGGVNTLIGISSFVSDTECGRGRIPGVFASVPALRNWITSKIGL